MSRNIEGKVIAITGANGGWREQDATITTPGNRWSREKETNSR
jgi:hypothetical protein